MKHHWYQAYATGWHCELCPCFGSESEGVVRVVHERCHWIEEAELFLNIIRFEATYERDENAKRDLTVYKTTPGYLVGHICDADFIAEDGYD